MNRRIFFYFFMYFMILSFPLWAVLETDTHGYVVSKADHCVIAISKQKGAETIIPVGSRPMCMVIHEQWGYVAHYGTGEVYIIDLETHNVTKNERVAANPLAMRVYQGMGYVLCENGFISVLDFATQRVVRTIHSGIDAHTMVLYEHKAYLAKFSDNQVYVLNLKTGEIVQTIRVRWSPSCFLVEGDKGYVTNFADECLTVLDLKIDKVIKTIPVGKNPYSFSIYGEKGYVVSFDQLSHIAVIDLKTDKILKTIPLVSSAHFMNIYGNKGFVNCHHKGIFVIDLLSDTLSDILENPKDKDIDFYERSIYLGVKKVAFVFKDKQDVQTFVEVKQLEKSQGLFHDHLSPQEILDCLLTCKLNQALDLLLALYEPILFINTAEGQKFCDYIASKVIIF